MGNCTKTSATGKWLTPWPVVFLGAILSFYFCSISILFPKKTATTQQQTFIQRVNTVAHTRPSTAERAVGTNRMWIQKSTWISFLTSKELSSCPLRTQIRAALPHLNPPEPLSGPPQCPDFSTQHSPRIFSHLILWNKGFISTKSELVVFGVDQPRLFWWFFILFMSTLNNRAIKLVLVSEKEGIRKCSFEFCYYRISLLFSQTHYFGEIKLLPSIIWNRSNLILNETGFHLYFLPMLAQKVQKQQ